MLDHGFPLDSGYVYLFKFNNGQRGSSCLCSWLYCRPLLFRGIGVEQKVHGTSLKGGPENKGKAVGLHQKGVG